MRKLLWFTMGFTMANGLYAYFASDLFSLLAAIFLILLGLGFLLLPKTKGRVVLVLLIGFSAGLFYCHGYDRLVLQEARNCDGQEMVLEVEATEYAVNNSYGYFVDGRTQIQGKSYRIRLYYQGDIQVKPGDLLTDTVTLRYTPEGGTEPSTYHKGEGIFLLGYAGKDVTIAPCEKIPAKYFAAQLRKTIIDRIDALFPADTAAFSKALLLGEDNDLPYQDNLSFQRSGIRHVVAVSGLHVSILFSVLYFLTGRKKFLTLLVGFPLLFVFAAVAGFSPSVVRACMMQGLIILAAATEREYDPGTALSFAVLVMLAVNPLTVTSVSFQLSVGCMIGIFAFSPGIRNYLHNEKRLGPAKGKSLKSRLIRWFIGSVSVSVSALVITLPLCAIYFSTLSLVGIVTNLLTLWLITYIFIGIIVVCLVSAIWIPPAMVLAWIIAWPIRFVLCVAEIMAKIPLGCLYSESPYTIGWIFFACIAVLLFLLSKKKPVVLLISAVLAAYLVAAALPCLEPYWGNYMISVVDVGQGQCVILQSKNHVYLVDCGGQNGEDAATKVIHELNARGIGEIDGVIVTHYDTDHCNGVSYLSNWISIRQIYLPDVEPGSEIRQELTTCADTVTWVTEDTSFSCGKGEISIFPENATYQSNESSLCILFQDENCDILITGDRDIDGEKRLLEICDIPDLEVLIVGHHGAPTSTGMELLEKTHPEVAVISVGSGNPYHHPGRATLDRLNKAGCIIRRTDLEGTIIIRG